ncbi:hypothetical protein LUZ60_008220 [Juncus effusus]|nr:hypothetical protein LUZ60_008220 [Juncus effusus]
MSGKAAAGGIPAAARRMVQSLKEIVNCPEAEIYATLKDCDMNPDEAVNRLLSQDTFHEVKSKREKKKDVKDTGDSRSRSVNNNPRSRVSSDRGPRNTYYPSNSNDNQGPRVKGSNMKENESSSILGPATGTSKPVPSSSSNPSTQPAPPAGILDGPPLSSQPPPLQNAWSGLHGHMSMADVVKMGRPQAKAAVPTVPAAPVDRSYTAQYPAMPKPVIPESSITATPVTVTQVTEDHSNGNVNEGEITDDWTLVEEPQVNAEQSASYENYGTEDNKGMEGGQVSFDDRSIQVEDNVDNLGNEGLDNAGAYQSQHSYEHHEVEETEEEVAGDFQQLSLQEEESLANNDINNANNNVSEENPAVIIPNHLQVSNADCAHLSFGSFGSGAFSGIFSQKSLDSHPAELAPVENEASTVEQQTDAGNEEYYNSGALNNQSQANTRVETMEMPSVPAPDPDVLRNDAAGPTHGLQYSVPSAFANTAQPEFRYQQGNSQLQNLTDFSTLLQANLLAPPGQPVRDFDLSFSPLVTSQAIPNKYMTAVPSTSGSTINMQEAAKQGVFSNQQQQSAQNQTQIPQTQAQTQAQTIQQAGALLPQQLAAMHHPYSQPTLPFTNLIGYPFLPHQSYTYLPSFQQQPYSANGNFHQSAASIPQQPKYTALPQYKNSISAGSNVQGQQGSAVAGGYGGFGGAGQGGFGVSGSGGGASTSLGFDEAALSSQYNKEMSHYMSLQQQQNENPAMWLHGAAAAGSRTLSTMPASTFYSYQGQTQHGNFRQGQQPSQLNSLGYPNFYHSQIPGGAQDHLSHQSTAGDSGLAGAQPSGQQQPSHQLWQNTY